MALHGKEKKMGEVMEAIEMELNMAIDGNAELVPTIVGDPGIGKSASAKALAKKMNLDCYIVSLGAMPMEYFSGLPEFVKIAIDASEHLESKTEVNATEWTMADLVRSINVRAKQSLDSRTEEDGTVTPPRRGLMVLLDDLHLVEPVIQNYLFEFFQNKTLQNFKLHPNAYLVAAMNGKDSAGLQDFHSAVLNRMAFYFAEFDKDYWYQHVGYSLHPYIASFAQTQGTTSQYFSGANSTEGQSPSPRTWTDLSKTIPYLENSTGSLREFNAKLEMTAMSRVGEEAATVFMTHVKLFQAFNFRAILDKKDPDYKIGSDISDQILSSFIIRYIENEEDAKYLYHIMQNNLDTRNFISVLMSEFVTLYSTLGSMEEGDSKKALTHLADIIVSNESSDTGFLSIVMDALTDMTV